MHASAFLKTASGLHRIDDHRFLYRTEEDRPVIVNVAGIYDDGHLCYRVASAARKLLQEEGEAVSQPFSIGGRSWKILPKSDPGGRFWSLINRVQKIFFDTHAKEFEVTELTYFGNWFGGRSRIENVSLSLSDFFYISGVNDEQSPLADAPYQALPFTDPFTALAAAAYQQYESCYRNKDRFSLADCDTRIVYDKGLFRLVDKNDPFAVNEKAVKQTAAMYLNYIRKMYGEKKIEEVDFRYGLNLDRLSKGEIGLTPEHVYRVNIGVNYVEMDNIREVWSALYSLYHRPNDVHYKVPLDSYLETISDNFLPGRVKRSIYRLLRDAKGCDPNKGDLIDWLHSLVFKKSFESITLDDLNTLIHLILPDKDGYERSLTGRKIYGFIRSYYTNADYGEYKPWVDQQELLQTIYRLLNQPSEDFFLEKLCHVVVKKHLARELPGGDFRVGAIIPAPCDPDEKQNWYKVTSCVSTPQGMHSYTLESVLPHCPLSKIKLYRSTSHNGYALRSASSVLNDLNGLNSPGYEGKGLSDSYEVPFFYESSIPLWTAYALLAGRMLPASLDEAYNYLCKANRSLDYLSTKEHQKRNLRQIIRKHDAILNELYRLSWASWSSFSTYAALHEYLTTGFDDNREREEQLGCDLYKQLAQFSKEEQEPKRKWAIVKLKDELYRHVIFYCEDVRIENLKKAQSKYQDILEYEKTFPQITDPDTRLAHLYDWVEKLEAIAKEQNENIESKTPCDLILAGHSLGGACAELQLVHNFVDRDRMPLPGHRCLGYFLDDPAINDEDNERFKNWGWNHRELFEKLNAGFALKRRQEAGDIVPLAGEVHLGATFSEKEDQRLKEWLDFDYRLRERRDEAKNLAIALSACAHETQFEEGEEGIDYLETRYSSEVQGLFDTRSGFYTVYDEEKDGFIRKDFEPEASQEKWDALREKWNLDSLYSTFESEWFRTHRYCSLFYYLLMGSDADSRISRCVDDKGIFAVDEKGVISKKLAKASN
jgi:hypothetical protein